MDRGRCRVQHQVELFVGNRVERRRLDGSPALETLGEIRRARNGAVRDHEEPRVLREKRCDHATRGAPRAHQQDAHSLHADSQVVREIRNKPRTIGVVGLDAARVHREEIRRAGKTRALARMLCEAQRFDLERQRHVRAAPALRKEARRHAGEVLERRGERRVLERLARLFGEVALDRRRKAVRDGIADDDVAIHRGTKRSEGGWRRGAAMIIHAARGRALFNSMTARLAHFALMLYDGAVILPPH